jgi:RNA polymerase sigma factor (sigma-70 family)
MPFEHAFEKIRVRLVQYASFKGMGEHAEDVAQETLVVLLTKYTHIDSEGDLVPLAYRICKFKIFEARRGRVRLGSQLGEDVDVPDPTSDVQWKLENEERDRTVKAAIADLSERCQILFRMRLEERATAEMARVMEVPEGTIYVWEHRCRKLLFERLR